MPLILSQIALPLDADEKEAVNIALKKLGLSPQNTEAAIYRRSVDARRGRGVRRVYAVYVDAGRQEERLLRRFESDANILRAPRNASLNILRGTRPLLHRPVVVGMGPAGLFAALLLARQGLKPLLLERGAELARRVEQVDRFFSGGHLDENTNVQFGEGGAGTFSDGKLVTRTGDSRIAFVMDTFVEHGAPRDILIEANPHIGTDRLRPIISSIRSEVAALGGQAHTECTLTGLNLKDGKLSALHTSMGDIPCSVAVLALGHSARDTLLTLYSQGLLMEKKPFSVGVRMEHTQQLVDTLFYREAAGHPSLPSAEYRLSHREGVRGCYTFCMCPGGVVVPAASERAGVVTNGMSYAARADVNANAALVASVLPDDISGDAMDAIAFQRELEGAAYRAGGGAYCAPAQSAQSFLSDSCAPSSTHASYARGVRTARLEPLLPTFVSSLLKSGLRRFDRSYPGLGGTEGVLTGLETRTSSPLRIVRGDNMESVGIKGVYPAGEGAGYAGGIVSAAVDGVRVAQAILALYGEVTSPS